MYRAAPQLAALDTVEARAVSGLETLAKLSGQARIRAVRAGDRRLLSDQRDRACLRRDGRHECASTARDQKLSAAE